MRRHVPWLRRHGPAQNGWGGMRYGWGGMGHGCSGTQSRDWASKLKERRVYNVGAEALLVRYVVGGLSL